MTDGHVIVSCPACEDSAAFDTLGEARSFIETHRTETGHEATWELPDFDSGVQRAGDEAGVCGRPECTSSDSPLYQGSE